MKEMEAYRKVVDQKLSQVRRSFITPLEGMTYCSGYLRCLLDQNIAEGVECSRELDDMCRKFLEEDARLRRRKVMMEGWLNKE